MSLVPVVTLPGTDTVDSPVVRANLEELDEALRDALPGATVAGEPVRLTDFDALIEDSAAELAAWAGG